MSRSRPYDIDPVNHRPPIRLTKLKNGMVVTEEEMNKIVEEKLKKLELVNPETKSNKDGKRKSKRKSKRKFR